MPQVLTTCPYCGVGCGVLATANKGRVEVRGDPAHPANLGKLCVKGSALGETYDEAVKKMGPKFGGPGKKMPAKPDAGQSFDEVQWTTADMLIRAVDRGDMIAVVWVDREIQDKLPSMRKNKMKDQHSMDPDVAAALKKDAPPDPKKEVKDDKKNDGKTKGKK